MLLLYNRMIVMTAAFALDMLLGDPRFLYHPVRIMGNMISGLESLYRKIFGKKEKAAGFAMVITMVAFWSILPAAVLLILYRINIYAGLVVEIFMGYQMIAAKDLCVESGYVYEALKCGDIELARKKVSMIVGRDTDRLDAEGITRAAVETVAENASDGVIAPLFYLAISGGAGAYLYKAINTMDSMTGYKNEKYINFGYAAAKLDDIANYIPARISGLLIIISAFILSYDGCNAWRIFKRDRYNHKSPNSAQTEAACAGALNIRLAGDAWYFGELYKKPYIGDDNRKIECDDIKKAHMLMIVSSIVFIVAAEMLLAAVGIYAG